MSNLYNALEKLDNAAKVPALRAIVHSMMAKAIGAIRQHLRQQERSSTLSDGREINAQRNEEQLNTLDGRNDYDENTRSVVDIAEAMGFPVGTTPMQQAFAFHSVYEWAAGELATLSVSKWDAPLSLDGMLEFMTSRAQPIDKLLVQALAKAAKTDEATILRLHELQEMKDRENLKRMLPEIRATFEGFRHDRDTDGYAIEESLVESLPPIVEHQLGVKVYEALNKAKDQVLMRVMRSRRITDLASVPLIEEGVQAVEAWVTAFEKLHTVALHEAIDAGMNLRDIESVRSSV
jgi:hypothetical protein